MEATCAHCGFANPPGFAFCGRCGTRFAPAALAPAELARLRAYLPAPLLDPLAVAAPPTEPLLTPCITHLAALLDTSASLIPPYLLETVIRTPVPGRASGQFVQGTLLFADISGFTNLSELLSHSGREGAEQITAIINRCFSTMLAILRDHDGQLVRFGGDALLALFPGPEHPTLAVQAAMRMQAAMAEFAQTMTSQGPIARSIKIAVRTGRCFAALLGSAHHMEYALLGADGNALAAAEAVATRGMVVLDPATYAALTVPCRVVALTADYLAVQAIEAARHVTPAAQQSIPQFQPTLVDLRRALDLLDALVPLLPAGFLSRLVANPHALGVEGEHRLVAVLFAYVHGLGAIVDLLGPGNEAAIVATLNTYFTALDEAAQRFGGVINKIDLATHGDRLVVILGAPQAHEDDAERAVHVALAMHAALEPIHRTLPQTVGLTDLCVEQQIGVNYGYVFAGYVGTRWHHEYTVMGDEVNLAARLMGVAPSGAVTVSHAVRRRVQSRFELVSRGEVHLKGGGAPLWSGGRPNGGS